jgi:hypothetical protein
LAKDAPVIAWPPTYKGGYERLYKFLRETTRWSEPAYDVFDPKDLPAWVMSLREAGVPFWVGSDHRLEGLEPAFAFFSGTSRPVYAYATADETSVRARPRTAKPFKYTLIDPGKLTESTAGRLVVTDSGRMDFLKDKYLQPGLLHFPGLMNFLVFLDGMLAGGFIYRYRHEDPRDELYIQCDFALSRERRLSKLIAMLATSEAATRIYDRRFVNRIRRLNTTAFTDKPVSMKYRGVMELKSRKPGFLNYTAAVRPATTEEVYRDWYRRFGQGG